MMAAVTGKAGTILYDGGAVATINSWSLDIDTNMHDITSFSTDATAWRSFVDGLSGYTGSIDGIFDSASTGQKDLFTNTITPTTAAIILEMDQTAGGKFTGGCFLESLSVGVDIDSPVDVSWSFQGTGALTYTTST
jgi:hypothetical protein